MHSGIILYVNLAAFNDKCKAYMPYRCGMLFSLGTCLLKVCLGILGVLILCAKNPHDVQSHLLMSSLTLETYAGNVILTGVYIP